MVKETDVVVVGGGYAGVLAASRLTRRDDVAVTLINPRSVFVERIRLHQLVAGSYDAATDFREVLNERVRLVVDTVERINAGERDLTLASGGTVGYDYLIYAVGSGSTDAGVPGAAEFTYPIASLEQARQLRSAVDGGPTAPVTVVGAGPAGIETAAELAEQGRHVTLVCGGPLGPYLHPRGRRLVAKRLATLGVTVLDGPGTAVTAVTRDALWLADGRVLPNRVTVWAAGFGVPDLAARSGLTTDAMGRLRTDETLTSVDDDRIVAAGDSAAPSGLPFRMSCQAAVQLGTQAGQTVLDRIAGAQPAPARVGFLGQCISLGRGGGVFQFASRDDRANRYYLGGRAAAKLKEVVCRQTVKSLAAEARKPGSVNLRLKDPRRQRLLQAQDA